MGAMVYLREKHFFNLLVFLLYLMCFVGLTEIAVRIFFKDVGIPADEKTCFTGMMNN
jgi:hypothetical protein